MKANPALLGYVGKSPVSPPSRDSDDWHTPHAYVESARLVMGAIDLDPFSSRQANTHIGATWYFSRTDDALSRPTWLSAGQKALRPDGLRVWMNPPYGPTLTAAIKALLGHVQAGEIAQAIVLVNNATETAWFAMLRKAAQAVCFTDHRISFIAPDEKNVSGNTRGQVFFYLTRHATTGFIEEFTQYGWTFAIPHPGRSGQRQRTLV